MRCFHHHPAASFGITLKYQCRLTKIVNIILKNKIGLSKFAFFGHGHKHLKYNWKIGKYAKYAKYTKYAKHAKCLKYEKYNIHKYIKIFKYTKLQKMQNNCIICNVCKIRKIDKIRKVDKIPQICKIFKICSQNTFKNTPNCQDVQFMQNMT